MNLDEALQTFFVEARELLTEMEAALLHVAEESDPTESINAIFRAAHTIKGSAGLFGLDRVVAFTHGVEGVLDEVRGGTVMLDHALIELLLACGDHIGKLVDAIDAHQQQLDPETEQVGAELVVRLNLHLAVTTGDTDGADDTQSVHAAAPPTSLADVFSPVAREAPVKGNGRWHISLRFGESVLRNGMDPLSFIRYLSTLGAIEHIVTISDALPALDALDAESCHLGFEISFASDADQDTIENVFEFVRDDCAVCVLPAHSDIARYVKLIGQLPEEPDRISEVLVRCGSVSAHELEAALHERDLTALAERVDSPGQAGEIAPARPVSGFQVAPDHVVALSAEPPVATQKQTRDLQSPESQSVRVDAAKLDRLIDLVGELITAAASANIIARRSRNAELQERTATLADLVEGVRDSALQLRMVKIGATFGRFRRVVHDVARELGKDIQLFTSGEDTELDKTVVEKIGDPLMHLVRNAMDHGIDAPDVRITRGKPARGTVALNAYHDSGSIVIEVSDDGGGLDRDKILAKAIERGLVEPGKNVSDAEIYGFIFEPGFSTANQITNLSGRGVGMDVVKRNITALRGSVGITSQPGRGTTVTVRLPLTLAIINGFQVGVGQSVFVVPLETIDECIAFSADAGHDYTDLRGQVLPFIQLRALFAVPGEPPGRQNIVVVKHAGQKFGLVVDTLMGEAQTVIKPLSKMFAQVKGISGSSILGSGEVALILDVPVLLQQVQMSTSALATAEG